MNNLLNNINKDSILIIPNNIKEDILLLIRNNNIKYNIKIFSLEEFIKKITFDYDEYTIYELMKLYQYNYNVSKLYLDNIKYVSDIDIDIYTHLKDIKKNINNYLIIDKFFSKYLKNKHTIIYGYDYIDKYSMSILNELDDVFIINKSINNYKHDVQKFNTLEEEVIFVAEKISYLISSNIDINNIFIANIDNDYYSTIKRIFKLYGIPININEKTSLYNTNIGKYFINNLNLKKSILLDNLKDLFDINCVCNSIIYKKILSVINKFYFVDDLFEVKDIIINVMKNTYINKEKYKNAINEIDLNNNIIGDDKYIFLVNFNLDKYPHIVKDEDLIPDRIKSNNMEKSYEMNLINNKIYYDNVCSIKNIFISYKEKYLNQNYFPSLLIDNYNMNVINDVIKYSYYSDNMNKLLLTKLIDNLIKYNDNSTELRILNSNYSIDYNTYNNRYSKISVDSLYKYLNNKLNLSYSSMNTYYHCAFKYYLSNVLSIDKYENTIETYIGNLYHYVLSKCFDVDFNFDEAVNTFLKSNEFDTSFKNDYFIKSILPELESVIDIVKYQNNLGNMNTMLFEKKVVVDKNDVIDICFKGFIDKLLLKDNMVAIIDYKTYKVDVNLRYIPYGLSLQLPVYLYLTKNINKDYEIIGFYLQQVLLGKNKKENKKTLKEIKKNTMKLNGYTIGNEEKISVLDSTYQNSELISGMRMTKDGFGYYSKVLTDKQIDNIIKLTDTKINECIDNIKYANFIINPKRINNKNIGCEYCKFRDICYVNNKDIVDLPDIKDISFLDVNC